MNNKNEKIYRMPFSSVYPLYVKKAERKNRSKDDVDNIIFWLTGHTKETLKKEIYNNVEFETFFKKAPRLNPKRVLITGKICGVKIEEITDPVMKEIRYFDKLVDELAKGKSLDKILRD